MLPIQETAMTILAWLERLSPLFFLAVLLITFFSLREMSRQRKETYKPRLFLRNQAYHVQKNPNGTPCFLKNEDRKLEGLHARPYMLELTNIGLGAAHTIRVRWDYDTKRIIKELTELGRQSGRLHNVRDGHFQYVFNINDNDHGYGFKIARPAEVKADISFLQGGSSTMLPMPDTIRHVLTFFPYLKLLTLDFPHRIGIANNEISLHLEFQDISGEKHRQSLQMVVDGSAFGKEDHNGNYGTGSLSFHMMGEKKAGRTAAAQPGPGVGPTTTSRPG
jgi:hypothetical protein